MKDYKEYLINWLKEKAAKSNTKGFVVGMSGGIDSAVVGALAKATGLDCKFISMPIESERAEHFDSLKMLEHLNGPNVSTDTIDLSDTFNSMKKIMLVDNKMAIANIKPRLRMTALYAVAQDESKLVLGTDNFAEYITGYFTKWGDGGCDLLPIVNLSKGEVREIAKILELPKFVIDKKPTAGLWNGQTDEEEMGISYDDIDKFSLGKKIDSKDEARLKKMIATTEHKRSKIPFPKPYNNKINI